MLTQKHEFTKKSLIDNMMRRKILKTPHIIKTFQQIDRKHFINPSDEINAYEDKPLQIDAGQTISKPSVLANMIEKLQPQIGENVLDVGSGSGWSTAILAHIVGEQGNVIGVELLTRLIDVAKRNIAHYGFKQVRIVGAKKTIGFTEQAPYDRILVSAWTSEIPKELLDQLKTGGTMVIPISNSIVKVSKISDTQIKKEEFPGEDFTQLIETAGPTPKDRMRELNL